MEKNDRAVKHQPPFQPWLRKNGQVRPFLWTKTRRQIRVGFVDQAPPRDRTKPRAASEKWNWTILFGTLAQHPTSLEQYATPLGEFCSEIIDHRCTIGRLESEMTKETAGERVKNSFTSWKLVSQPKKRKLEVESLRPWPKCSALNKTIEHRIRKTDHSWTLPFFFE